MVVENTAHHHRPVDEGVTAVKAVLEFTHTDHLFDDMTMVMLKKL